MLRIQREEVPRALERLDSEADRTQGGRDSGAARRRGDHQCGFVCDESSAEKRGDNGRDGFRRIVETNRMEMRHQRTPLGPPIADLYRAAITAEWSGRDARCRTRRRRTAPPACGRAACESPCDP